MTHCLEHNISRSLARSLARVMLSFLPFFLPSAGTRTRPVSADASNSVGLGAVGATTTFSLPRRTLTVPFT